MPGSVKSINQRRVRRLKMVKDEWASETKREDEIKSPGTWSEEENK